MSDDVLSFKKSATRTAAKTNFTRSTSSCSVKMLTISHEPHHVTSNKTVGEFPRYRNEKPFSQQLKNFEVNYASNHSTASNFNAENKD